MAERPDNSTREPTGIMLTPSQRRAAETTGKSLLVPAAAGSGKTAVLAERCAYLVCDAPESIRCEVDQLLVLTFTDAAAAEMRGRIVEAARRRMTLRPRDERLQRQLSLVDVSRISTIHSFCLWLARRWFADLDLDPQASVLDAEEALLIRREVLGRLFENLYASADDKRAVGKEWTGPDDLAVRFRQLVDIYGLGDDRTVTDFVLRLSEFVNSLPKPEQWLEEARRAVHENADALLCEMAAQFRLELERQSEHVANLADELEAGDASGLFHAGKIREYVSDLQKWIRGLAMNVVPVNEEAFTNRREFSQGACSAILKSLESVRQAVGNYKFPAGRAPNLPRDVDPAVRSARDRATRTLRHVREDLFQSRLRDRFSLFTLEEWRTGLRATAPFVSTFVDLVQAFRSAYGARKRKLSVMDFADLERFAYRLLAGKSTEGGDAPSAVASLLHDRFHYVLVDEFQDINPLQQAVIQLVSRESDAGRPNNLFAVGDEKQSIYRFRLAEPALFSQRRSAMRTAEAVGDGEVITLQDNFRSRPEVLEAVNIVFRELMRGGCSDISYDAESELRAARSGGSEGATRVPVELHLLERTWSKNDEENEESNADSAGPWDPSRWSDIEREAYWIGMRIQQLMNAGEKKCGGESLSYRDVAVLLRVARINAERAAAMLSAMGIPAHAAAGASLFAAVEVRDALAALEVLDNARQDIPLAAVLRNGILGDILSEDELVEIRSLDRKAPFHETVRRYTVEGTDPSLRERLSSLWMRMDRYRKEVRLAPLSEVLWDLYERHGFLAHAQGLANGRQRYANLLKLHDLSRRFGTIRHRGLRAFLQYVRSLENQEQDPGTAPVVGESEDVVRVMSIHQSKGLEFPIVFVAGLGTRFHLGDRTGDMIFERRSGIGLRVMDTERMIAYPSAAHLLAAAEIERTTREEELRILYVAMTRARDRLVLVGSQEGCQEAALEAARQSQRLSIAGSGNTGVSKTFVIDSFRAVTAQTPLQWLVPIVAANAGPVETSWTSQRQSELAFRIQVHEADEMSAWRVDRPSDREAGAGVRQVVARLELLPPEEPRAPLDPVPAEILSRLDYVYPQLPMTCVRAAIGAGEFKGTYDWTGSLDHRAARGYGGAADDAFALTFTPRRSDRSRFMDRKLSAVERGILAHRALQHLNWQTAINESGIALELDRLVADGILNGELLRELDADSLAWFAATPLADAVRSLGESYRREFPFISSEPPSRFDDAATGQPGDSVLVRGIVDGVLPFEDRVELIDFKTDAISIGELASRAESYRPQMELYARAVSRLWKKPVKCAWLVFLSVRQIVTISDW